MNGDRDKLEMLSVSCWESLGYWTEGGRHTDQGGADHCFTGSVHSLGGTSRIQIRFQDHRLILIWDLMEKGGSRNDDGRPEKGETRGHEERSPSGMPL